MSAPEKNSLKNSVEKLGIIAGGGELPRLLAAACERQNIEPFIIAFDGQTDAHTPEGYPHLWTRLGAAGKVLKTLKSHDISDIVMIGRIRRPSVAELRPDMKGAKIMAKIGLSSLGDDGLLRSLRSVFEHEGFTLHGVHKFDPDLLADQGVLGKAMPDQGDQNNIQKGAALLKLMSPMDVGQSVIVQQGIVLGIEAAEGTDALIERCAAYKRKGRGGVLVKMPKDGQDFDFDLPTIGVATIEKAAKAGLSGLAYKAGATLLVDKEKLAKCADKHKIFMVGI
jgi:DUF1009 family protein